MPRRRLDATADNDDARDRNDGDGIANNTEDEDVLQKRGPPLLTRVRELLWQLNFPVLDTPPRPASAAGPRPSLPAAALTMLLWLLLRGLAR